MKKEDNTVRRTILIIDGVKYQAFTCPKCQTVKKYRMGKKTRRFYGVCSNCRKRFEVNLTRL